MSRLKGRVLPEDLLRRIGQTGLPFEEAILMLTVDKESWPHVAMLSRWEVFAPDERTIRVATYLGSRTSNNLLRDEKVTLVFVNETMSYLRKGRCNAHPREDVQRRVQLPVHDHGGPGLRGRTRGRGHQNRHNIHEVLGCGAPRGPLLGTGRRLARACVLREERW